MARHIDELLAELGVQNTVKGRLKHFGVKGMRWGVRKPRGAGPGPASSASNSGTRFPKAAPKSPKKMSDQELRKVLNRIQMEKQYAQLTAKETSVGRQMINNALKQYGQQTLNNVVASVGNGVVTLTKTAIANKIGTKQVTPSIQVINAMLNARK